MLRAMQSDLRERARQFRDKRSRVINTLEEFEKLIDAELKK